MHHLSTSCRNVLLKRWASQGHSSRVSSWIHQNKILAVILESLISLEELWLLHGWTVLLQLPLSLSTLSNSLQTTLDPIELSPQQHCSSHLRTTPIKSFFDWSLLLLMNQVGVSPKYKIDRATVWTQTDRPTQCKCFLASSSSLRSSSSSEEKLISAPVKRYRRGG